MKYSSTVCCMDDRCDETCPAKSCRKKLQGMRRTSNDALRQPAGSTHTKQGSIFGQATNGRSRGFKRRIFHDFRRHFDIAVAASLKRLAGEKNIWKYIFVDPRYYAYNIVYYGWRVRPGHLWGSSSRFQPYSSYGWNYEAWEQSARKLNKFLGICFR